MLKFIKMKYHDAYCIIQCHLLLLSFLPWLKTFLRIEVRDEKKLRIAQVCTFLCLKFLISADETKTRKSCSRFEIKWQSTWFRHGFLNLLIWFSLERLHSLKKKIELNKNEKKKKKQERSLIPKSNRFVGD